MSDIISLNIARANATNDNTVVSPAETLRDALFEIESGKRSPQSILILTLDKGPDCDCYGMGWYAAKLQVSEIIALLEHAKYRFIKTLAGDDD